MRTNRIAATVAFVAATALGATACASTTVGAGTGASAAASVGANTSTASTAPSNPVTILRRIKGCHIDPSVTVGDVDINGNRFATCKFDGKWGYRADVHVTTYPGPPPALASADDTKVILGDAWTVEVVGDWTKGSWSEHVDYQAVADEVGGSLQ